MSDPFDPSSNYELPKGESRYLKFEKGVNTKFMPLAPATIGYEYWNTEGKPVRSKEAFKHLPADIRYDKDGNPEAIKHFWAFPVFDYASKGVKVLEITQKTIQSAILAYTRNLDWGSPVLAYSFTVSRTGDGFDTEYTVMANPKTELTSDIGAAWEEAQKAGFDITRLFDGGDPFGEKSES